jgi:hypothetical protein
MARLLPDPPVYWASGWIGILRAESWQWRDGQLFASGYPRPIPGVQRRNHGISFTVAQASGLAAKLAEAQSQPIRIDRRALGLNTTCQSEKTPRKPWGF